MSVPVMTFYCSKCDFQQGDAHTWGSRAYVTVDDRIIQVPRRLGWCEDCRGVASVEMFAEDSLREEIRQIDERMHSMPSEPIRRPWEVYKYLPFSGWGSKIEHWHYKQEDLARKLDEATLLLAIIKQRQSPPRCLECGSTRVIVPLVADREFWDSVNTKGAIGFIHPDCGGELLAHKDGLRIAIRTSKRYYTPEGVFIERVFDDD